MTDIGGGGSCISLTNMNIFVLMLYSIELTIPS